MNVLVWNCQGAASKVFRRTLKNYLREFKPTVLCLLEPRVSGDNANDICFALGYDEWLRVEAIGFSGGIWVFWKTDIVVQVSNTHPQFVLLRVTEGSNQPWNLSFVYGSPDYILRRQLFTDLSQEGLNFEGPWLSIGDYNSVFEGPQVTWTRGLSSSSFKAARLDRALCNVEWRMLYPDASVTHLPMVSSNHSPLLIKTIKTQGSGVSRNFKYNAAWTSHPGFMNFVKDKWNIDEGLEQAKMELANDLLSWNHSTFGSIFQRKKRVLVRIEGVQKALANRPRSDLIKLNKKLQKELEEILNQEELYWFQKSREDWIASGDRNTRFYHAATAAKKANSRITTLRNNRDEWLTSDEEILNHITDFFTNLYTEDMRESRQIGWRRSFPTLLEADRDYVNAPFSALEVKEACFDMAPCKALGPDGYHAGFY
ncbi:PREDICTED: uncharacterized protein LOC109154388 [Ipomoea nil]|uniref:uncharacterized protein LOC109154388 n=1 Tax=Ipomoea nil TaxID=35883 RepID=UPI000901EE2A|nr:PREDICTED: uncharacterized protein LOC109154388 [Ipomoea nil]